MSINNKNLKISFPDSNHILEISLDEIKTQATSSLIAKMGGTVLLVTVTTQKAAQKIKDMLPLSVFYSAPFYAAGKLPGGFNKRESKASDQEVIEARLVDRSIRPLFAAGFADEVQVIIKCLSYDPEYLPSNFTITATAIALRLSGLPVSKTIAGVRVGCIDGNWVLNPDYSSLANSSLDMFVSGSDKNILMMECRASEIAEKDFFEAERFAHKSIVHILSQVESWIEDNRNQAIEYETIIPVLPQEAIDYLKGYSDVFKSSIYHPTKKERAKAFQKVLKTIALDCEHKLHEWPGVTLEDIKDAAKGIYKEIVRNAILHDNKRMDGRCDTDIRPIDCKINVLPRVHGSAVFTRGETQALVIVTLGGDRDAQIVDSIHGDVKDRFLLHYNFPPYSVGECAPLGPPKRRELGHGRLAKMAFYGVMPSEENFAYVVRIVSEITSCNGSSSMATVCGASLALMASGVPLTNAVAGIAMGVIVDHENHQKHRILSDILGEEDGYGYMDLKVAGTKKGITAVQMDVKMDDLSSDIFVQALERARIGRLHILDKMNECISESNQGFSDFAPKIITFQIKVDKIREVIGKGGSVIKDICEKFDVTVDISETGVVKVSAVIGQKGEDAKKYILDLVKEVSVNEIYEASVIKIMDFGAFVQLMPGKDGFLHISEISSERVNDINQVLKRGQIVTVKVLEIDQQSRIRVTMKDIDKQT